MIKEKTILVTGDLTIDENIYQGDKASPENKEKTGTIITRNGGGVFQLYQLIKTIAKGQNHIKKDDSPPWKVQFGFDKEIISANSLLLKNYAVWEQVKYKEKIEGIDKTWKVKEKIGFGPEISDKKSTLEEKINTSVTEPNILVLDDSGSHFRNRPRLWEHLLHKKATEYVVFKLSTAQLAGNLFNSIVSTKESIRKLIIVTSLHEIRKNDVMISKGLSWEQTTLDLIYELTHNKNLERLRSCRHLIVTIQSEGALYLEIQDQKIQKARLIFDPSVQEGEWDEAIGIRGEVIGLMNTFTAALVSELSQPDVNFISATTKGLSAQRKYKIIGHMHHYFPYSELCETLITNRQAEFSSAFVPIPDNVTERLKDLQIKFVNTNWTILEGNYLLEKPIGPLYDLGIKVALFGDKELLNSPLTQVKFFTTYDREEIESLRNIKVLMDDYRVNDKGEKPLSIAVFGAPGSGKSFAVKQLAKFQAIPILEFNLSQFEDVNELTGAFHQVRDLVLQGVCPIIFWDEFDSQNYRWLQYLLAPMQDGQFQEGQITHPIGKAIFIFAGGTSYTFDRFGMNYPPEEFKLKKGPDFKSRLSGFLNVKGPNQLEVLDEKGNIALDKNGKPLKDPSDIFFPIRRALFIRGVFGVRGNDVLQVDPGLINALIRTDKYKHGSRSLEKLLSHLKMKDKQKMSRSNLPSTSILSILVDYSEFISYFDQVEEYDIRTAQIAPEIHNNWMKLGDTQGWKLEFHRPYYLLPTHMKNENIAAAARIPKILKIYGFMVVPQNEAEFHKLVDFDGLIKQDKTLLDSMAQDEHKGWVEDRIKIGCIYDAVRNDDKKIHNCLVDWDKLSEKEKGKDRDAVNGFRTVLKQAGYIIVKANGDKKESA